MSNNNIRNFCIIAHIDHGKSTLADRMLEITGTVDKRQLKPQYLDSLESERERGITIKMAPVRMVYRSIILNLIDTPGHTDFRYEVSRSLAAVEGAVLLVDATQGIQAQTLANLNMAKKAGLKIIGVVTKVDLSPPHLQDAVDSLADLLQIPQNEILKISGKTGEGVEKLLEKIIEKIPPPAKRNQSDLSKINISRALIFDSLYNEHKGIIAFVRIFDGGFKANEEVKLIAADTKFKIKEIGRFTPFLKPTDKLMNGEIGYIATGIKDTDKINIGDTITEDLKLTAENSLAGYQKPQPVVFVSFYPEDSNEFDNLKQALAKLKLNDASLIFEPDKSELLGRGFKGGFLGQLHLEITAERLEKEFGLITIQSFPSVVYKVKTNKNKELIEITSPKDFPDDYLEALEPIVKVEIITPAEFMGAVLSLKQFYRFSDFKTDNLNKQILMTAKLPLADLISDLDDKLKSFSEGYASLSYELIGYESANLVKMEILIAGHLIPGLTRILPQEKADREARRTLEKLKALLPHQQFAQALQAQVRGHIIARENISAMRKDVTGYLYGGDRTRKDKLLKKQKKGKARLKELSAKSKIHIPGKVFKELLKK